MRKDRMFSNIYHNLAVMLEAGVEVGKAFKGCAGNRNLYGLKKSLLQAAQAISQGQSISQAMGQNKKVFGNVALSYIEAAEQAGNVPGAFAELSQWHSVKNEATNKIFFGLLKPFIILTVALSIFPIKDYVAGFFNGPSISAAQLLMQLAMIYLKVYGPILLAIIIYKKTPATGIFRLLMDALLLKIPILGKAMRFNSYSQFCKAFAMLYNAGIPLDKTIESARIACGNSIIAFSFRNMPAAAKRGDTTYEGLPTSLPNEFRELWFIGEESGTLYNTSLRIAKMYGQLASEKFKAFADWLPRIVYGMICIMIIVMILSMARQISPAFNI